MTELIEIRTNSFEIKIFPTRVLDTKILDSPYVSDLNNIIDLHLYLIRNLNDGWYAEVLFKEKKYLLNDHISSKRIYVNTESGEWSTDFWSLQDRYTNLSTSNINELKVRGYLTNSKTILNNVDKLLPGHFYDFDNKYHSEETLNLLLRNFSKEYSDLPDLFENEQNHNKKIGVAFSGGLDSTFIASKLKLKYSEVKLYYMFCPTIDHEAQINLIQSKNISSVLGLDLISIDVTKTEIDNKYDFYKEKYPNDISIGFVALKIFIDNISKKCDIIYTGQNSDTFLTFGLSRAWHPIESLSRFAYYKLYKSIFYNKELNSLESSIMNLVYKLRRLGKKDIPNSKQSLLLSLGSEKYYLAIHRAKYEASSYQSLRLYEGLNYSQSIIANKFINHISGNHSLVWSDNVDVEIILPFSDIEFIGYCCDRISSFSFEKMFDPKNILKKNLNFKFNRVKESSLTRVKRYLKV